MSAAATVSECAETDLASVRLLADPRQTIGQSGTLTRSVVASAQSPPRQSRSHCRSPPKAAPLTTPASQSGSTIGRFQRPVTPRPSPSQLPTMTATARRRHFEAGGVALWPTLIARTTPKTVTTNHGGSKFAGTTERGVAEGVAMAESVSESHADPNRTAAAMRWSSTLRTRSELSLIRP